jgi:hypothetical protein
MIVKTLMIGPQGQVAAFDAQGQQIPELQLPVIELWARHAESLGFKPDGVKVEMFGGIMRSGHIFKTETGWNVQ